MRTRQKEIIFILLIAMIGMGRKMIAAPQKEILRIEYNFGLGSGRMIGNKSSGTTFFSSMKFQKKSFFLSGRFTFVTLWCNMPNYNAEETALIFGYNYQIPKSPIHLSVGTGISGISSWKTNLGIPFEARIAILSPIGGIGFTGFYTYASDIPLSGICVSAILVIPIR